MKKVRRFLGLLMFLSVTIFAINFATGYFGERANVYIYQKATFYASSFIEKAIREKVVPNIDIDNLVKYNNDETGTLKSIAINTVQVNNILSNVNMSIQESLISMEENETLSSFALPLGIIISDTLFLSEGPKLTVKILPVGAVTADVVSVVEEYGINNSLLKICVVVKVSFQTAIPFNKNKVEVVTNIPIITSIINGEVPRYYYYNTNSGYVPHPVDVD